MMKTGRWNKFTELRFEILSKGDCLLKWFGDQNVQVMNRFQAAISLTYTANWHSYDFYHLIETFLISSPICSWPMESKNLGEFEWQTLHRNESSWIYKIDIRTGNSCKSWCKKDFRHDLSMAYLIPVSLIIGNFLVLYLISSFSFSRGKSQGIWDILGKSGNFRQMLFIIFSDI